MLQVTIKLSIRVPLMHVVAKSGGALLTMEFIDGYIYGQCTCDNLFLSIFYFELRGTNCDNLFILPIAYVFFFCVTKHSFF